jgi:catechol 2,3-dioxygenase-like lactoylglutathione lyase family enzyme/mannose-6-phosphate isomerase-like protein (cupin superfamily)
VGREGIVGIHHMSFNVENLDRTIAFYTQLLGFDLRSRGTYQGDRAVALDFFGDLHAEETGDGVTIEVAVLELTGARVEFMQWHVPKPSPFHRDASVVGTSHLGVRVKNLAHVRSRLEQAGVVFRSPVEHSHAGVDDRPWRWCGFVDPDGIFIELIQEETIADLVGMLGSRIREMRLARSLTLQQAATMSEISTSHLSQIERGDAVPSLQALVGISATLGVAPEYFLRIDLDGPLPDLPFTNSDGTLRETSMANRNARLVTADNRQMLKVIGGVEINWLTNPGDPIRVVRTRYETGAVSEDPGLGQSGAEVTTVLEGMLEIRLRGDSQVLEAGASVTYDRATPRRFSNPGKVPAVALQVFNVDLGEAVSTTS